MTLPWVVLKRIRERERVVQLTDEENDGRVARLQQEADCGEDAVVKLALLWCSSLWLIVHFGTLCAGQPPLRG